MTTSPRNSGIPAFVRPALRTILARAAIHENVTIGPAPRIGRGVVISSPHGLEIGAWANIGPRTIIQCDGHIGDFALIGMGVQIVGKLDHDFSQIGIPIARATYAAEREPLEKDSIAIGRDVWIGGASVVLSGIEIGSGSIIGSGAVVTRDVPAYTIVGGNPARPLGKRFDDDAARRHEELLDQLVIELQQKRRP